MVASVAALDGLGREHAQRAVWLRGLALPPTQAPGLPRNSSSMDVADSEVYAWYAGTPSSSSTVTNR